MAGPLDHLIVIDASTVMAGSIATMLLADHGAEVIKVEPHGGGCYAHDATRKSWERGKKSVELDVFAPADRDALLELIARADIFVHSLDAEDARQLGLDQATICTRFPQLIYCGLSAYGIDTELAGRPYGGSLAAARLGAMIDRLSPFREGPVYLGHPALDYGQAFLAVIDVLAALRVRNEDGRGQAVDASLLDSFLAQSPMNYWWNEHGISYVKKGDAAAKDRFGRTRLVTGMFECSDGLFLQMHTGGEGAFKTALDLLGFGDRVRRIDGSEMAVPLDDDEYQIARVEIYEAFKVKTRDEWIAIFHAHDVAALPVLRPAEVLLDEQVEFANGRIELPDPEFGTIHQAAPALRFLNSPASTPAPAPAIGAHNGELSKWLAGSPPRSIKPTGKHLGSAMKGLRVLDLSSFFACGYGCRLLADLGADVIKIESPSGDQMRALPNPFEAAQRGKRGIVVDLKSPEGIAIIHKLVETADVVMHNMRPGKAEKLGIGYNDLAAINPRLIYAYLPGYGSRGPKAKLKSFAPLMSGWTGLLYTGGGEGNPPTTAVFGNEDYNNGFLGAVGVLMALERRHVTGRGDYFECPQLHSSLFASSEHFLDKDRKLVWGMRVDQGQMGFNALDRLYRTADGRFLCISCRDDLRFAALCAAIERTDLLQDARFDSVRARTAADGELVAILESFFSSVTAQEAMAKLDAAGAAAEIAVEESWLDSVFWAEWAEQSGRVTEVAGSMHGRVRMLGAFTRLAATPAIADGCAPRLGEHTQEILGELGFGSQAMSDLLSRGIVAVSEQAHDD